jgi:hypothetical protein
MRPKPGGRTRRHSLKHAHRVQSGSIATMRTLDAVNAFRVTEGAAAG